MTIQLSETKEERTLISHQKHLKNWDRYEQQVEDHFNEKLITEFGSLAEAEYASK